MYLITNISNSNIFAGNVNLEPGHSTEVSGPTAQLLLAISRGLIQSTPTMPGSQATALTDNSGGTASNTLIAVPSTYTQAELANALASLAAVANTQAAQIASLMNAVY